MDINNLMIISFSVFIFLVGFILGLFFNLLFNVKYSAINNKILEKQDKNSVSSTKNIEDPKLQKAKILLDTIRKNGKLPIRLNPQVIKGLKVIANSNNWENEIDSETLNNIIKIYNTWQAAIKSANDKKVIKGLKGFGFEKPDIWEGTFEEYQKAIDNGIINENTKAYIIDNSAPKQWITYNDDGSVEEWME